jgi:GNAT superfamily N-acetyltransferase
MPLAARTYWTLQRYWADRLGVSPSAFEKQGMSTGHANEGGVQLFSLDGALVIGSPASLISSLDRRSSDFAASSADDSVFIKNWLADFDTVTRVIGPAFYGYADRETFDSVASAARVLTSDGESAYDILRAAVLDDEWEQGGMDFVPKETVGLYVDNDLVASAGYDVWDGLIAHLAVITHPDHRNKGHGRAVVSRATERALADGLLPQYRTADAWPWSVALAENLGFERFATAYLGVDGS